MRRGGRAASAGRLGLVSFVALCWHGSSPPRDALVFALFASSPGGQRSAGSRAKLLAGAPGFAGARGVGPRFRQSQAQTMGAGVGSQKPRRRGTLNAWPVHYFLGAGIGSTGFFLSSFLVGFFFSRSLGLLSPIASSSSISCVPAKAGSATGRPRLAVHRVRPLRSAPPWGRPPRRSRSLPGSARPPPHPA